MMEHGVHVKTLAHDSLVGVLVDLGLPLVVQGSLRCLFTSCQILNKGPSEY